MSRRIFMRKRQGGLFPSDTVSEEVIDAIKESQLLTIKLLNDRNQKHHRLFRALLRLAFDNQERYATEKSLHNAIKNANGFCEVVPISKIERHWLSKGFKLDPHSTNYDSMTQAEFSKYYDKVVPFIIETYFGGDSSAIIEAKKMLDVNSKT
jgi:hypothetical protein